MKIIQGILIHSIGKKTVKERVLQMKDSTTGKKEFLGKKRRHSLHIKIALLKCCELLLSEITFLSTKNAQ